MNAAWVSWSWKLCTSLLKQELLSRFWQNQRAERQGGAFWNTVGMSFRDFGKCQNSWVLDLNCQLMKQRLLVGHGYVETSKATVWFHFIVGFNFWIDSVPLFSIDWYKEFCLVMHMSVESLPAHLDPDLRPFSWWQKRPVGVKTAPAFSMFLKKMPFSP